MPTTWIVAGVLAILLFVPLAAADAPTLRVTVDSDVPLVRITPGGRATVNLTVMVEFIDYPCPAGTEVGVDLVPPASPPHWFGADPHPDGNTYAAPKQTKPASLVIVVDEDAPSGAEGRYRLQPVVKTPASQTCGGVDPKIEAPEFSIEVFTPSASTSPRVEAPSQDTDGGNDLPAPSALSLIVLGLGVWLFGHRRK